jgi:hypothetical protein
VIGKENIPKYSNVIYLLPTVVDAWFHWLLSSPHNWETRLSILSSLVLPTTKQAHKRTNKQASKQTIERLNDQTNSSETNSPQLTRINHRQLSCVSITSTQRACALFACWLLPPSTIELPAVAIVEQHSNPNTQHPTSNIQHPAGSISIANPITMSTDARGIDIDLLRFGRSCRTFRLRRLG